MWQRIQTLYLIIIALLMGIFAFSDIFLVVIGGETMVVDAWTKRDATTGMSAAGMWGIGILSILSAVVAVVQIFMFKQRVRQSRLGVFNAILLVGLCALIAYAGYTYSIDGVLAFKFALALPPICVILQILAVRAILADETLVRMSERLR